MPNLKFWWGNFRFQWIEWAILIFWAGFLLWQARRKKPLFTANLPHELAISSALCLGYFGLAALSKWTQFYTSNLNALDFWLFEDLLRQSALGGINLTRFTKYADGWVQHGTTHSFIPLQLFIPFVWAFGATTIALVLNPVAIAAAAFMLRLLAKTLGLPDRYLPYLVGAFLLQHYVSVMVGYDTHPETLYPLFTFTLLWAVFSARKLWLIVSALALSLLKIDSFLVFGPLLLGIVLLRNESRTTRKAAALALVTASIGFALQLASVELFRRGIWGPKIWQGEGVTLPQPFMGSLITEWFDPSAILRRFGAFLGSGAPLSLACLAPWLWISFPIWVTLAPLAFAFSQFGEEARLWNYYSAPFIAVLWSIMIWNLARGKERWAAKKVAWIVTAALAFGSVGLNFYFEKKPGRAFREAAQKVAREIDQIPGRGLVSPAVLSWVAPEKVAFYRSPSDPHALDQAAFVFVQNEFDRFELRSEAINALAERLDRDLSWQSRPTSSPYLKFWVRLPARP